jgi:hypothetical protein
MELRCCIFAGGRPRVLSKFPLKSPQKSNLNWVHGFHGVLEAFSPPRQLGSLELTCGGPSPPLPPPPPPPPSPPPSPPPPSSPLHSTQHTTPHHTTPHLAHIASHMASQPDATSSVDLAHIASHMAGQPDATSSVDLARYSEIFQNSGKWPPGPHRLSYGGPARRYVFCGPGQIFKNFSKSGKNGQFRREK